ncbi:MAG: hypothetical protein ACRCVJ_11825 [Clostridium sp.]|uniref:hypothetical protein n=1 Tax=Clostridium sp. TaxID=1506 RepID=UPI003F387376
MITYKKLLDFNGDKEKKIVFTCFNKEYTLNNLESCIENANIVYSPSEGLEIYKDSDVEFSLKEVLEKIHSDSDCKPNNIENLIFWDENLIFWDEDCAMLIVEEIIELDEVILFI